MPNQYRELSLKLPSVRLDRVVCQGLSITRQVFEADFYSKKFYLNGKLLTKKSQKLKAGDGVDYITNLANQDSARTAKRVRVVEVIEENGNPLILLRVWRQAFPVYYQSK